MTFWSGETLLEWIPRWNLIDPFDETQIDCAAYTLHMGREAYITPDYKQTVFSRHKKTLLDERGELIIPPGQFGFLLTEETIRVPPHIIGFISLKTTIKFRGLINVSGFHVDPGFTGNLIYAVYNAGPSPIRLERGTDLCLIWFAYLDRHDSDKIKRDPPISNISPQLIAGIPGQILTLQSLSAKIGTLENSWFRFKVVAGVIGTALFVTISVLSGLLRILDWAHIKNLIP